ncbi:hypothetical protein X753_22240 [Mesorhizobium sp. LNJC399B00]|nr:hypothetical protein X753_22240 [Mesorhizobium sp. LNJC399B00]
MLEGRNAAERVMLEIPGRSALGGKDIDRHKLVVDAFFRQHERTMRT